MEKREYKKINNYNTRNEYHEMFSRKNNKPAFNSSNDQKNTLTKLNRIPGQG